MDCCSQEYHNNVPVKRLWIYRGVTYFIVSIASFIQATMVSFSASILLI